MGNTHKYALMFHDVYNKSPSETGFPGKSSNSFKISRANFIQFVDKVILKAERLEIPLSKIIFTFDDGGSSALWIAKELNKRNITAYFFISTGFIGKKGFCNENDLKIIDEMGHIIGNHTHSHPGRISTLTKEQLWEEWSKASDILKKMLNKNIKAACIPGGHFSLSQADILNDLGYKKIFTNKPVRKTKSHKNVQIIGRYPIQNNMPTVKYLSYFKKYSRLRSGMFVRWQLLEIIKFVTGPYYDYIRNIVKGYNSSASEKSK